jgi:hypothetical protein
VLFLLSVPYIPEAGKVFMLFEKKFIITGETRAAVP